MKRQEKTPRWVGSEHVTLDTGWKKKVICCAVSWVGCYSPPGTDERFDDSIVVTSHDDGVDFTEFRTFFVRPDVRVLDESTLDSDPPSVGTLPMATASSLVDQLRTNLASRGYLEGATKEEADLAIEIIYLRSVSSEFYCYYWGDWGYWGYSSYNYYYPYSCDATNWRSGMTVVHAVNLMSAGPAVPDPAPSQAYLRGVWFAGIYGAELNSMEDSSERTIEGIDQAFVQSPYFKATP